MPLIQNTTIATSRVIAIISATITGLGFIFGVYFAAMNGVRDGFEKRDARFSEIDLEIQNLGWENKLQNTSTKANTDAIAIHEGLIKALQEAGKPDEPDEPTIKSYRK